MTYITTVSYTHLDVYKRQRKGRRHERKGQRESEKQGYDAFFHFVFLLIPVSYTHLEGPAGQLSRVDRQRQRPALDLSLIHI